MSRWTTEVRLERAIVALMDPAGELDAVEPLSRDQAIGIIRSLTRPRPHLKLMTHQFNDDELIVRLGGDPARSGGMVRCPAHEDRLKSLSWRVDDGKLLLHCFAGCTWDEIRAAL